MARFPVNVSKVVEAWKEVAGKTGQSADVVLAGDPGLVGLAQQRFASGGTLPATCVRPLAELSGFSSVPGELLVVFILPEREAEVLSALGGPARKGRALLVVDDGAKATGNVRYPGRGCTRLSFSDTPGGWRRVFAVCVDAAGDHAVALGRRYPAIRDAAANHVVYQTAGQNALIGLAFFIPGADMPAMTLNQAKMALSVASIYGEEINQERAVEMGIILGLAFGMRALARYLVRSTSGVGWAIKAATAYAATVALGLGAIRYFQKGAPASTSKVVALAGSLRR